jgi:hypothetical protein
MKNKLVGIRRLDGCGVPVVICIKMLGTFSTCGATARDGNNW